MGKGMTGKVMAEGEGFEPPVRLPARLISSQVPSTTQPPFRLRGIIRTFDRTASEFSADGAWGV